MRIRPYQLSQGTRATEPGSAPGRTMIGPRHRHGKPIGPARPEESPDARHACNRPVADRGRLHARPGGRYSPTPYGGSQRRATTSHQTGSRPVKSRSGPGLPSYGPSSGPRSPRSRAKSPRSGPRSQTSTHGSQPRPPATAPRTASLEAKLIRWMVGTVLATAAQTVGTLGLMAGSGG